MLEPAATHRPPWVKRHVAGLAATLVGIASLLYASWWQFAQDHEIMKVPDARVTVPLFGVVLVAAIAAFVRREPARALPIAGLGMAGAAMALGWLVVAAGVALVCGAAILVIAKLT